MYHGDINYYYHDQVETLNGCIKNKYFRNLSVSLKLGSEGVAYSSIVQQFVASVATFVLATASLATPTLQLFTLHRGDFSWLVLWTHQGLFSGLESLIRNLVYLIVVLRGMNLLHEQDVYWIANNFIWSWLLLPVLSLSELLRQDVATSHPKESWRTITPAYCCLTLAIVALWGATCPGWHGFIVTVLNAGDRKPGVITQLVFQLIAGYLFFIVSHLNRSIFYAKGKVGVFRFSSS